MDTNDDVFDYQVLKLTSNFYNDYPNTLYREILEKPSRSYNCLLIQSHYGYFICNPYRSEISHRYAYMFKNSMRSREHRSGLDYTKIIITNSNYIDNVTSVVDQDEYNETRTNIDRIKQEAMRFVDDYVKHMSGDKLLAREEFRRKYKYSPLKYFHQELGIVDLVESEVAVTIE